MQFYWAEIINRKKKDWNPKILTNPAAMEDRIQTENNINKFARLLSSPS